MAGLPTIALPECRKRVVGHVLNARQRRDIIRILASEGKAGLEKWLREEERRDPYIRKRVQEEHERLQREARSEKRRLEGRYGKEREDLESGWEKRMTEQSMAEAGLRSRLEKARAGPTLTLEQLAETSPLFAVAAGRKERRSPVRWLLDGLMRIWLWLLSLWVRLVRTARGVAGRPPDRARVITLPDGMQIELGHMTALDPRMVAQVRMRMREGKTSRERLKQWWDRLLGREDYADIAKRLMEDELRSRVQRQAIELETEAATLESRLRQMEREGRDAVRERRGELDDLDQKRERDLAHLERRLRQGPYEQARDEILDDLMAAGLVSEEGTPTEALLERFSNLLYDEARRTLPSGGQATPGTFAGGEGEYHKGPILSLNERGAMELVDSAVAARLRHPHVRHIYDQDLIVHREVRTARTHVVLIFDQSGSMEEKGRLEAAKTVCLVMYRAVKEADPMNRVDIIAMSTGVEHVDLGGLWNAAPKGFTNHGAALREARYLLEMEGADRRLVYLITDGLPEAMTVKGTDTADRPEICMPYALEQARLLSSVEGVRLFVIQLETEDPLYLDAARKIAKAGGGEVEAVEPERLTKTLLLDFEALRAREERAAEVV